MSRAKRKERYNPNSENVLQFKQKTQKRQVELVPKTFNQENLILALNDESQYIVVTVGPAGSGKTYLAMLAAIRALKGGEIQRIVLTRPAVGVEDEKHGFLPGTLEQKMEPWTRPLLDVLGEYYHANEIKTMMEDGTIEISPLAFMRGRTFKDSVIIADEMQNATPGQMKMLLTRIGEGSRIVVTGDIEQTDKRAGDNGLLDLADRLEQQGRDNISICRLSAKDIQRHPVIDTVLKMYQD